MRGPDLAPSVFRLQGNRVNGLSFYFAAVENQRRPCLPPTQRRTARIPNDLTFSAQDYTSLATPGDFIDQSLWTECLEIAGALEDYLSQATERIIRDEGRAKRVNASPVDFLNPGNRRAHQKTGMYRHGGVQMTGNAATALITGGTSGIGLATAKKLAQLGIHVLVVGRNVERGKKAVEEIRAAEGKADFISSELRGADTAREVARKAIELGNGHVDILINNAGIYPFGPTHEMTEEQFDRVFSTNVKAPYFLVAELAPLMAKRGKGAIVNLSTMAADYGAPGMSLYGSSKAAINLLTKTWAAEYGPKGVRVNAVSPGPTRTEGTDAMGEGLEQLAAQAPAGRPAAAEEIAEAIVFLATDRASFIHGAKLAVDGGRTAI
jgi:NAD(P)-dependent dehydrogenase (short-subunit alcohol dehydrogenase family)